MTRGSRERCVVAGTITAVIVVVAVLVRSKKRGVDRSERARQRTPEGEPIEDEWGRESFPASDPPQSW